MGTTSLKTWHSNLRTAASESTLLTAARGAIRSSVVIRSLRSFVDRLHAASETAATTNALTNVTHWARTSFLYRWLTKEPEPEVIVIDLRETYTVGPIIALLDRSISAVEPSYHEARLRSLIATATRRFLAAPVRVTSLVVGALSALLFVRSLLAGGIGLATGAWAVLFVLSVAGTQVRMSWDELVDSRAGRLLLAVLEPPEPTEKEGGDEAVEEEADAGENS